MNVIDIRSALGPALADAVLAALIGTVLLAFFRTYRRDYLFCWSASWFALCAQLLLGAVATFLALRSIPVGMVVRATLRTVPLVATLWQLAWLAAGAQEIATGLVVPPRTRRRALLALTAAGLVLGVWHLTEPSMWPGPMLARTVVPNVAAAVLFPVAAWGIWRSRVWQTFMGRRLVSLALLAYGIRSLLFAAEGLTAGLGIRPTSGILLFSLTHSEFGAALAVILTNVLQLGVGVGLVVGLLDEERERSRRVTAERDHLAFHDVVSGLPHLALFCEHVTLALAQASRLPGQVAVFAANLDRFRMLNDSLGRTVGDEVIRVVARRLRGLARGGDAVGRLGPDVFGLLYAGCDPGAGEAMAQRLLEEIRRPLDVFGQEVVVTASVGFVMSPAHGAEAEVLVRCAEQAAERVKRAGGNGARIYDGSGDDRSTERFRLEAEIRRVVDGGQLIVYFQPIADPATRSWRQVEALARWAHPSRGLLAPADFLPLAEHIGIVDEVDRRILELAAAHYVSWHTVAGALRLAVNVSARSFYHPDLPQRIGRALGTAGMDPESLELEISETVAMEDADRAFRVFSALHGLGVHLAIDDFGTGHSSLAHLRRFPVDTVKLDRSFVRDLADEGDAVAIAAAVIALSHSLGMRVVAEGVETEAQLRILREQSCDLVQGFLFSAALPADACAAQLGAAKSVPAIGPSA